uniref:FoP_duplication domain-containing protein n=1 Tax=Strongyloides venezuelensis TaxID=75913 RepID=A0A0K0F900_STRVS
MSYQYNFFTQLAIRNICKDVTVKDIADLFKNYHYKKFSFEYDNYGKFTGCVVLHCTNYVSEQIKRDFAGCCIDGKLLSFETIYCPTDVHPQLIRAIQAIFKHTNIDKSSTRPIQKKKKNMGNRKFAPRRESKHKISKKELDLELEEYFKSGK